MDNPLLLYSFPLEGEGSRVGMNKTDLHTGQRSDCEVDTETSAPDYCRVVL